MAEAVFAGLLRQESGEIAEIIVANRSGGARLDELKQRYGVTVTSEWQEHVSRAGTIVLAMPPGDHREVLAALAPHVDGQFVVTVAAGIGTGLLEELLPPGTPVAWVMPNTAAAVGASISLYTYGQHVQDAHEKMLRLILGAIGESERCTEEQIHDLTAITGSAPAFLYAFAEALEASARTYGVSPEQARKLVGQMIAGSAAMLQDRKSVV
jgi:pyrroline-5-carboxylate reductase